MGHIFLSSNLNAIIRMTSYYCVLLKMVILHHAVKQFRMGFLCFSLKKKDLFVFKKTKNSDLKENQGWLFFQKNVFFNPDYLSILFF